ncbi:hypothetical protein SBA6_90006 [Candidatus Sulfopaludibacter sp. SbA6]|nr:hypothetical protein SBA6_90006 [Candidatus Sulfopaludibacter sp. SbA6]
MWHNFLILWNKSIYFKGAVVVFAVGVVLMFK